MNQEAEDGHTCSRLMLVKRDEGSQDCIEVFFVQRCLPGTAWSASTSLWV
jgi:hypothetical protein